MIRRGDEFNRWMDRAEGERQFPPARSSLRIYASPLGPSHASERREEFTRSSRGFTILELMLVLAILCTVGALTWPSLQSGIETQRLKRCADNLRNEWTAARVRAMTSGETLAFRHTLQGRGYQVVTWSNSPEALVNSGGAANVSASLSTQELGMASSTGSTASGEQGADELPPPAYGLNGQQQYSRQGNLLERVTFHESKLRMSGREFAMQPANELSSSVGVQWSSPIYFFPDGATSTATVYIKNERDQYIRIHLRGLTGIAEVSGVSSLEELPP